MRGTTLTLEYPPPLNNMYPTVVVKGKAIRVTSSRAKKYKRDVAEIAEKAGMVKLTGPVTVRFLVYRKERRGDLDGTFKAILDALKGIAYNDDEQVNVLLSRRFEDKLNPRVVVTVAATADAFPRR